jgi:hypothetical protein
MVRWTLVTDSTCREDLLCLFLFQSCSACPYPFIFGLFPVAYLVFTWLAWCSHEALKHSSESEASHTQERKEKENAMLESLYHLLPFTWCIYFRTGGLVSGTRSQASGLSRRNKDMEPQNTWP